MRRSRPGPSGQIAAAEPGSRLRAPATTPATPQIPPTRATTPATPRTPPTPATTAATAAPAEPGPGAFELTLAPVAAEEFFAAHWERAPLVVPRGEPERFDGILSARDVE